MNVDSLRTVLLVKAIEDQDAAGSILPQADREAATRAALRQWPAGPADATAGRDRRLQRAESVLVARATELYGTLAQRHPVIARTVALESQVRQTALLVLAVAFAAGLLLSIADSRVRIDVIAFPLLGLIAWNLLVYTVLGLRALRGRRSAGAATAGARASWIAWPARWGWRRARNLVTQAAFYHRPLAAALRKFSDDWWPVAEPLLLQQGKRAFHLASAALACGLVVGFYVRGVALEYRAGWESTFLGPDQVIELLRVVYGPAAALTGIDTPTTVAQAEALHWRGGAGGGPAAPWIHLMATTALLYVIVPRLLLAVLVSFDMWRAGRKVVVPDSLLPYARAVLAQSDAAPPADTVQLVSFAYQPSESSLRGAERLLHAAFGADARVDRVATVAYGDEALLGSRLASADVTAVLLSLAATPEVENHGAVLGAARDHVARAGTQSRLLVLLDESPFLARMQGDASLERRIEERRAAWREFAAGYGLTPWLADLPRLATGAAGLPADAIAGVRRAAHGATA